MATVAEATLQVFAQLFAQTSATVGVTNPGLRAWRPPAGQTDAIVAHAIAGKRYTSNLKYTVVEFEVTMLHQLTDPASEVGYVGTTMVDDQEVLMDKDFWKSVDGIFQMEEGQEPTITTWERIGNLIRYEARALVWIDPE